MKNIKYITPIFWYCASAISICVSNWSVIFAIIYPYIGRLPMNNFASICNGFSLHFSFSLSHTLTPCWGFFLLMPRALQFKNNSQYILLCTHSWWIVYVKMMVLPIFALIALYSFNQRIIIKKTNDTKKLKTRKMRIRKG